MHCSGLPWTSACVHTQCAHAHLCAHLRALPNQLRPCCSTPRSHSWLGSCLCPVHRAHMTPIGPSSMHALASVPVLTRFQMPLANDQPMTNGNESEQEPLASACIDEGLLRLLAPLLCLRLQLFSSCSQKSLVHAFHARRIPISPSSAHALVRGFQLCDIILGRCPKKAWLMPPQDPHQPLVHARARARLLCLRLSAL